MSSNSHVETATLSDGSTIDYVVKDNPPKGTMKCTYFTPSREQVVQFYMDPEAGKDRNLRKRLEAILGRYNPTVPEELGGARGNSAESASYFASRFCWPTAIVESPRLGIVCPAYPSSYWFTSGDVTNPVLEKTLAKAEKKSKWFTSPKLQQYLSPEARGDFRSMLQIGISLSRSMRRLHQAGLAHSDLSSNNVLIDPRTGSCVVIDIDSLVVPGLFSPEVAGTSGYIGPEVLATQHLPIDDPGRVLPSVLTDLHALPVMLYEYLLNRHPLEGPKVHCADDPGRDDLLAMGAEALFIEDPNDRSNRPDDPDYMRVTIHDLGPELEKLFLRAFVDGLHDPSKRPTAFEWEKALVDTWDLLQPCPNPDCDRHWFVMHDPKSPVCPFCGARVPEDDVIQLQLKQQSRGRDGQWRPARTLNVYDGLVLIPWHVYSNRFPNERTGREMMGYVRKHEGRWVLVNESIPGMTSPSGSPVPPKHAITLEDGAEFRISTAENGYLMVVARGGH